MTFETPSQKYQYVNQMFGQIAHRYDVMNRLMTAGQDTRWRKLLVDKANLRPGGRLLDIATGTGDIAFEALHRHPNLRQVVGADFTLPMMHVGRHRAAANGQATRLSWSGADTLHLPFPDNTFDAVASGFLMRNVVSVPQALADQTRVLKPGGRLLILEIPRPEDTLWGAMFRLYFHNVVPLLGGIISGQHDAYSYLPASADAFLRPEELKFQMEQAGLRNVSYQMLMLNTVALHWGTK
ncbi:MAG: bifunctional demethylmenaquinone methyltransferase/2-methoxy-6-polyprenyl-1,4-benzoquinol methylase UbiE [Chloroflexi bacterium]|nr:MAG: bifunctional demethylmenaquinone methyltransferase/2-methoxy-6-polyprenyl-1,4-benzoquinol methylase UbiE [Chloroflexota bacterium]